MCLKVWESPSCSIFWLAVMFYRNLLTLKGWNRGRGKQFSFNEKETRRKSGTLKE